jgi:hypothetical protein
MLIAAQSIIMYRCLTYIICPELSFGAWLATATQLLHGIGFSMTWSAGALQADQIAPAGFNGLGSGIGALVGGIIYERFGAQIMWATVVSISFFSIIMYASTFLHRTLFHSIARSI